MNFQDLKLSIPSEQTSFKFNDQYINLIYYLPVNDKLELIS